MPGKGQHSAARVAFHAAGGRGGGMARAFGGKRPGGHQARGHSGEADGGDFEGKAFGLGGGRSARCVDLEAGSAAFFLSFCFRAAVASFVFALTVGVGLGGGGGFPARGGLRPLLGGAGRGRALLARCVPKDGVARRALGGATGASRHPRIAATEALEACGHVGGRRGLLAVPAEAMAGRTSGRHGDSWRPLMAAFFAFESGHRFHGLTSICSECRTGEVWRQVVCMIDRDEKYFLSKIILSENLQSAISN